MIRFVLGLALLALAAFGALQLFDVDFQRWEDGSVAVSACLPWGDCHDG